jgi:hypothetical protein
MTYSNLSKIKPKLRTQGNITGNFGRPRSKAGSPLNDLGVTDTEVVKCMKQDEYLARLWYAFDNTGDAKLKQFVYTEIKKIHIQRGTW